MDVRGKDLQYVLDWIAIQDLVTEYGQAIDHGKDTDDWGRWEQCFTPKLTADYTRFGLSKEPLVLAKEQMGGLGRESLKGFTRVQHATATSVRIQFKSATEAQVMAYAEVSHFFPVGGIPQEWTLVARYTHDVEKTPEGWKIRKVLLDPIHQRGNLLGLEMVQGKRHL